MEIEKQATPTISRIPIDVSAIIDNFMISLLSQLGIAIQLSYSISQGKFKLTATLIKKQDKTLFAPVRGDMKRLIRESLSSTASYSFEEEGKTLFDFNIDRASFEYEFEN